MAKDLKNYLQETKATIFNISESIANNFHLAEKTFLEYDVSLIDKIKSNHAEIEVKVAGLEELCLKILALHQPVARDLKLVLTIYKLASDLERISSLIERIARKSAKTGEEVRHSIPDLFNFFFKECIEVVDEMAEVLHTLSVESARNVSQRGHSIYQIKRKLKANVAASIEANPEFAKRYINLLGIARHVGRVALLSASVCEEVIDYHNSYAEKSASDESSAKKDDGVIDASSIMKTASGHDTKI